MTNLQFLNLIAKLSRLTEARGATRAEAAAAHKKITQLTARLPARFQGLYVEGWPGQPVCTHKVVYRFGPHTFCGACRMQIIS